MMNKKKPWLTLFLAMSLSALAYSQPKPNVILILVDDMGYGDLGCYGGKAIPTPNIDALAQGGMRFTDFHSNGANCSPTRAALLTGRYQQRAGVPEVITVLPKYDDAGLPPSETTLAEVVKKSGYATAVLANGIWDIRNISTLSIRASARSGVT